MEHFKIFGRDNLTAVHRAGVLRFELEMADAVLVGTIKQTFSPERADWTVGGKHMELVFVDLLEGESLDSVEESVVKSAIIESAMWVHGDVLAEWFVRGEEQTQQMHLKAHTKV